LKPDEMLADALPGTTKGIGVIMTVVALPLGDVTSKSAVVPTHMHTWKIQTDCPKTDVVQHANPQDALVETAAFVARV
jgi:hypothetical protein